MSLSHTEKISTYKLHYFEFFGTIALLLATVNMDRK
jgi:hypothetical protein